MKKTIVIFLLIVLSACAHWPHVEGSLKFADIQGIWETTGYIHYVRLKVLGNQHGTMTMINRQRKVETFVIENLSFEKSKITFHAIRNSDPIERLTFEGHLVESRLMLAEAGSKGDILSFVRQDELTQLRALDAP